MNPCEARDTLTGRAALFDRKAAGMVTTAVGRHNGSIRGFDDANGDIFLVKSRRTEEAVAMLERAACPGATLVSVTRTSPDRLAGTNTFGRAEYYWLTNLVGDRRIPPGSLGRIVSIVKSHIDSGRATVIFLEGLEYLVLENGFNSVLRSVNQICDMAVDASSKVFISIDPLALAQRDIAMIERTCGAVSLETACDQL